jgi:DNA-binding winged helix-turn-helix (wHTH) protein
MRLAFGDCVLDPERRRLERGGQPVHLPPKVYVLLTALLEQRPKALSKEALCQAVWPGQFISDSSLANAVTQLRGALGDRGRQPPLLRTVHGFGYAFDGDVRNVDQPVTNPGFACVLHWQGRELVLRTGEHILGRSPEAAIWVRDQRVSRRHASLVVGEQQATLEDLDSRNGTFHCGVRIEGPVVLAEGDAIRIGDADMVVGFADPGSTLTSFDVEL